MAKEFRSKDKYIYKWRRPFSKSLIALTFSLALFWFGLQLILTEAAKAYQNGELIPLIIIGGLITLIFCISTYASLCTLVNPITIQADKNGISTKTGPLPYDEEPKFIPKSDIKSLFIAYRKGLGGDSRSYFKVLAYRDQNDNHHFLLQHVSEKEAEHIRTQLLDFLPEEVKAYDDPYHMGGTAKERHSHMKRHNKNLSDYVLDK